MRPLFPALLVLSALPLPAAHAAESYDNCTGFVDSLPAVISTQGTWCLRADLSTAIATGAAVTIAANNVTLDCNHYKLGGLAAGTGSETVGVRSVDRLNLTLRNCHVRGFLRGVVADDGGGHLIEHNRFEGNLATGITVGGGTSTVRGNRVLDTGGSTVLTGSALGIAAYGDSNHVLDNTVSNVESLSGTGLVYGIYVVSDLFGTVAGNRISGLGKGTAFGIYANGTGTIIQDNLLQGGLTPISTVGDGSSRTAIFCAANDMTARGNTMSKFDVAVTVCTSTGNHFNPN